MSFRQPVVGGYLQNHGGSTIPCVEIAVRAVVLTHYLLTTMYTYTGYSVASFRAADSCLQQAVYN